MWGQAGSWKALQEAGEGEGGQQEQKMNAPW
jgi:hypothetical protein